MKPTTVDFVATQREAASTVEAIPETDFADANSYKVVYRSVAVLLAPTHGFADRLGKVLSEDEVLEYLRQAHPYFAQLFQDHNEVHDFRDTYKFIWEAQCNGED